MSDQPKRGRGRPPGVGAKPPGERTQARSIRLSEDDWAWLDAQSGGPTREIRALILVARGQQAGIRPPLGKAP